MAPRNSGPSQNSRKDDRPEPGTRVRIKGTSLRGTVSYFDRKSINNTFPVRLDYPAGQYRNYVVRQVAKLTDVADDGAEPAASVDSIPTQATADRPRTARGTTVHKVPA